MDEDELDRKIAALVGRPVGSSGSGASPDPVNQPMIRHWAAAFEDWNPVYTDPEAAGRSRFGQIVAPPLMLQTWTMSTPMITGIAERGGSPVEKEGESPLGVLDEAGLVATLATNSELEIFRYLTIGDRVSAWTVIETVSELKKTHLGPGRFVTWATAYVDAAGEPVGHQRFRILKFDPGGGSAGAGDVAERDAAWQDAASQDASPPGLAGAEAASPERAGTDPPPRRVALAERRPVVPRPDVGRRSIDWRELSVGDDVTPMEIEVTATVIVAGAIASRDFMPVHHDRDYAQSQGAPDIFMNILSDTAYCSRFLTDWAGPEAAVRRLSIRLGVPVFPGQLLRYTGRVVGLARSGEEGPGGEGMVTVELSGTNDLGDHVGGTAEIGLPLGG